MYALEKIYRGTMETIISTQNIKIKEVARLKNTSNRKEAGLIVAEGMKLTHELIKCGFEPVYCFIKEHTNISDLPPELSYDIIYIVSDSVMKKMSVMSSPPPVITVAKERSFEHILQNENTLLALDAIQDPTNMGAIFRSAEAFGIRTILLGTGCCDCYSHKVLRCSMGSALRLNLLNVSLTDFIKHNKKNYTIIGTGLNKNYQTVDKLKDTPKKIIIIGNEGNGISNQVQDICDFGMYIPMSGENESLNAAVAASIILWENMRQNNE